MKAFVAPPDLAPKVEFALACGKHGLRVHPLHWPVATNEDEKNARCSCGRRCGKRTGKHPREKGWQQKATTDTAQIRKWWSEAPDANIGIFTGGGDLIVVDEDGDDGAASRAAVERAHGELPQTLTIATGRGRHLYFAKPEGTPAIPNRAGIVPGVDVRADGAGGGYAVGPGSLHWSGSRYRVDCNAPIAVAPQWLIKVVTGDVAAGGAVTLREASRSAISSAAPLREEDARIASLAMDERRRRALAYVAKADPAKR